jgi:SLOG in TRPM, prokaryote/SMODS and SLOG-associating 2TM effector domain 1/Protein of unknown function (DUF4231)
MSDETLGTDVETKVITFPNGNRSRLVRAPEAAQPSEILSALGLSSGRPVVLVIGGADSLDQALERRLAQLFERAVIPAAASADGVIVDGGTESGVMALLGTAAALEDQRERLIGVAPAGKVSYPNGPPQRGDASLDPNHSYFVLTPTDEWGGETALLLRLAELLSRHHPVAGVLAGGGLGAMGEVRGCVRRGWPIVILSGTGGLADQIVRVEAPGKGRRSEVPDAIAQIRTEGDLRILTPEADPNQLERILSWILRDDPTLKMAWEQFALYDGNASRHQRTFRLLQVSVLGLGVLATVLALTQTTLLNDGTLKPRSAAASAFHYAILSLPILITVLVGATARFRMGHKWLLLRQGAELIKSEIFRYRAATGAYRTDARPSRRHEAAASALATKVGAITETVMRSDVNESFLQPSTRQLPPREALAPTDDGLRDLGPADYLTVRVGDQVKFYRRKAAKLERTLHVLQWGVLLAGAAGAVLAAIGFELWIALTTGLAAAFTSHLGYLQVQNTLVQYNQAATNLVSLQAWWEALGAKGHQDPKQRDALVDRAEQIMHTEQAGWVQEMQDALEDLRKQQQEQTVGSAADDSPAASDSNAEPDAVPPDGQTQG